MQGNEKEWMADLEVKTILTLELQMMNKLLNDNYRSEELVFSNKMDYEVHNEKFVIQKSKVGVLVVLVQSIDVFAQSSNVCAQSTYLLAQLVEGVQGVQRNPELEGGLDF